MPWWIIVLACFGGIFLLLLVLVGLYFLVAYIVSRNIPKIVAEWIEGSHKPD